MLNRWLMVLIVLGVFISSCGSKKGVVGKGADVKTEGFVLSDRVTINNLDFHTFKGSAKTRLEFVDEKMDATMHIRMDKNKAIWVSITATLLNYEAVRVLITPDSVKVMDKLQSIYYQKPFSYLQKYTGKAVDFLLLQDLLLGNSNNSLLRTDKLTVAQTDEETQVLGLRDGMFFQYGLNNDNRTSSFLLSMDNEEGSVQVFYNDFLPTFGYNFAQSQTFLLRTEGIFVKASLMYQKVDFNEVVEMPFVVPTKYKRVE